MELKFAKVGQGITCVNTQKFIQGDYEYIAKITETGELEYYPDKEELCSEMDKKIISLQQDIWKVHIKYGTTKGDAENEKIVDNMSLETHYQYFRELKTLVTKLTRLKYITI